MSLIEQVHSLNTSITSEQRERLRSALGEKSWAAFTSAVTQDHGGDDDECAVALIRFASTVESTRFEEFKGFLTEDQQSKVDGILDWVHTAMMED